MLYAKIDEQGNVLEFPYRFENDLDIPADAVEVDTETNRPATSWNQSLFHDNVELVNGNYILNYTASTRYNTDSEKRTAVERLIKQYRQENGRRFDALTKQITVDYPENEILTWDKQITEAKEYLTDNTASVPFITTLAQNRGITLEELVQRIVQKEALYTAALGQVLGKYQKNIDILDSINLDDVTTYDAIDNYGW